MYYVSGTSLSVFLKLSHLINSIHFLQIRKLRKVKVEELTHFTQLINSVVLGDKEDFLFMHLIFQDTH